MIKNVFSFQHDNILFLNNREPKFKFVCLQNLPDIRLHTFSTRKNHLGTGILIGIIGSSTEQCACYSNQNKEELADVDENKGMECHPAPRPTLIIPFTNLTPTPLSSFSPSYHTLLQCPAVTCPSVYSVLSLLTDFSKHNSLPVPSLPASHPFLVKIK